MRCLARLSNGISIEIGIGIQGHMRQNHMNYSNSKINIKKTQKKYEEHLKIKSKTQQQI